MRRVLVTMRDLLLLFPEETTGYDEVLYVDSTKRAAVETAFGDVQADEVVGFGGGQAIDMAKLIGARNNCHVVAYPSAISTDAFLVKETAVREGGRVHYLATKKPDEVRLNYELLLAAPPRMNAAGWGDVLSIYTACFDWKLAAEKVGQPYDEEVADAALALLDRVRPACRSLPCRQAGLGAGRSPDSREGIDALVYCLRREVELCAQVGTSRPEEGSEHFFVYCLENYLPPGKRFLHGELVALGIQEMARWQGQDVDYITGLMDRAGMHRRAEQVGVSQEVISEVLRALPAYVRRHDMAYTIINERAPSG